MSWVKAIFILLMIGTIWLALIILLSALHLVVWLSDKFFSSRWSLSLFLAEDHLVNACMGGHFKTTISAEVGKMQTMGSSTGTNVARVINKIFYLATKDRVQKDHCRVSMELNDIYVFSPRRAIAGTITFQLAAVAVFNALIQTYVL